MIQLGRHSYRGNTHERFDPRVKVGNFSSIASDVMFMGSCQHPKGLVSTYPFGDKGWGEYPMSFGKKAEGEWNIVIGSDVWIGEGAFIMDGVTIGDGAIIGARAVVTKDVPAFEVWGGNPAKKIKDRFTGWVITQGASMDWTQLHSNGAIPLRYADHVEYVSLAPKLQQIAWWNWDDEKIKEALPYMSDIDEFIKRYS